MSADEDETSRRVRQAVDQGTDFDFGSGTIVRRGDRYVVFDLAGDEFKSTTSWREALEAALAHGLSTVADLRRQLRRSAH